MRAASPAPIARAPTALIPRAMPRQPDGSAWRRFAGEVARLAVGSLYAELCLYPKPGLVSLVDSGSHGDMNAATFMRSLFSLRHYFKNICLAGLNDAPFARLKQLGIAAETAMLKATQGVNTHRGAIFSLGLCVRDGRPRPRARHADDARRAARHHADTVGGGTGAARKRGPPRPQR